VELRGFEPLTYSMRTRIPGRLAPQAMPVAQESPVQSVGSAGCRKPPEILLRVSCGLGPEPPAASKPFARPVHRRPPAPEAARVRFILALWSVQSIIVRAVTRDRAEGLEYHVLPTDDPLRALNILREAAGLQPLSDDHDDQGDPSVSPQP
jgi:hypothetical protein